MKRNILFLMLLWAALVCCVQAYAQNNFSGKVEYLIVEDWDWRDSSQMPPLIKRNVKSAILYFDVASTFFVERTEGVPLSGLKGSMDSIAAPYKGMSQEELAMEYAENGPKQITINVEEEGIVAFRGDRYYESISTLNEMSKVPFAYVEHRDSVKINWKVFPEEKQIGELLCRKAVGSLRGRTYVAWYCPQIPVPYGPWLLNGLPGLIVEAHDLSRQVNFLFKSLTLSEQVKVPQVEDISKKKRKVKIVSREKYYDIMMESMVKVIRMLADTDYDIEVSLDETVISKGREMDQYSLQIQKNALDKVLRRKK